MPRHTYGQIRGPVPLQFGVPYFKPPEWKIKYLPTREEVKQLAQLTAEIEDATISEARRQVLIAQKRSHLPKRPPADEKHFRSYGHEG